MLGEKIKYYRKMKGWTQSELAAEIGVSTSTIGMYEQNRRVPDLNKIKKFSECFGISFEELSIGEMTCDENNRNDILNVIRRAIYGISGSEKTTFRGVKLTAGEIERVKEDMMVGALVSLERIIRIKGTKE